MPDIGLESCDILRILGNKTTLYRLDGETNCRVQGISLKGIWRFKQETHWYG